MSKILALVEKHFSDGSAFDYRDFEKATGVEGKVAAMNLKRLAIRHRIGSYSSGGAEYTTTMYFYRTVNEINEAIEKENALIDKYALKQNKLKLLPI